MDRKYTNRIRYLMDEFVPPIIRDSYWFMYPFFLFACGGKNIREAMEFKTLVYQWSREQYSEYYSQVNGISRRRKTDLNQECIDFILERIGDETQSLVDIGCGHGYLLGRIAERHPGKRLVGYDIKRPQGDLNFEFVSGYAEKTPFRDGEFDTVVCCHTVEHLLSLEQCLHELVRIASKQVIIVTPRQRYYYYTLDEHVNFFPQKELLTSKVPIADAECLILDGDWAYCGRLPA